MLIREAKESDAAGIARVQVDTWRTTYRGIVPDSYIDSLTYENREQRWRQYSALDKDRLAFVAETAQGQIVGFASAGRNQEAENGFAGELYAIYVLESYQGQGTGRLLVRAAAERLLKQQIFTMLVWVLADNPFRAFYESLGGTHISDKQIVIGGTSLTEAAYGWHDLQVLIKS